MSVGNCEACLPALKLFRNRVAEVAEVRVSPYVHSIEFFVLVKDTKVQLIVMPFRVWIVLGNSFANWLSDGCGLKCGGTSMTSLFPASAAK